MRKVSIDGGRPIAICKVDGTSRGASWGDDDVIVFATSSSRGLLSVPAAGGTETMLAAVNTGEREYAFPVVLPDRQGVVFDARQTLRGGAYRMFDVSKDGQQFVVVKVAGSDDAATTRLSIVVVHHWFENAAIP